MPEIEQGKHLSFEKPSRGAELTARARLQQLFDHGKFQEIAADMQHRAQAFGMIQKNLPGDGVICGFGQIDGQEVLAYSQDRSIMGGSLGQAHAAKISRLYDLAMANQRPVIAITDSGGARIQEGIDALAGYGDIFLRNVRCSGRIPQIALIMGPCAGGAVYSPALTDFVIMCRKQAYMFVTGPKVVKAVTSEEVDSEMLGGAQLHSQMTGLCHFVAENECHALQLARDILHYLQPSKKPALGPHQGAKKLNDILPKHANQTYEVNDVIQAIVDDGSYMEIQPSYACNLRVGFARLHGQNVGIVANNPAYLAGVLDIAASRKGARLLRTFDAFGLPIISLVDVPGFLPGLQQEQSGMIGHGAKLAYAYCEATVPKITIILRKAYGGAYIVMGSKHVATDFNYAWPNAEIAVMGAEGAVEILYQKALSKDPLASEHLQQWHETYKEQFLNPKMAAARGYIDAVIEPNSSRLFLLQALRLLQGKKTLAIPHGNIPL